MAARLHDPLTSLSNRFLFSRKLEKRIEQYDHVAVFSISFNSIYRINHDSGYKFGDDWSVMPSLLEIEILETDVKINP
ncbi:diguanylate cyclase domain-containing protein [Exiguobacterium aurantiacum]|uniref:GGDEF domain-containing protein n=1 Tax=Exiguobacterium aurantiacum TaxID=33987 RepID=A0A377FQW6_9BACL|nr:diguanylate cyclase [Exiguobacterium aurantiacum]STO07227.1 Uncharacterised protein [Exiguobacterium aurantiacum]